MKIHFIGIGGISMSALAGICINKGYQVSGSDMNESYLLDKLRNQGAKIFIGHSKEHISDDVDMVIYTAAVHEDNPEMIATKEKNKLTMNRAAFLGQIMREYKNSIAVSGTHGKTSTTSMLSTIFEYADLDPTILVGGNLSVIGGNVKIGNSDHFITEACEYVDSFLNFNPKISIVLNIEEDHLDYFSGIDEIKASFNKFGKLLPKNGYFIINGDDENTKDILYDVKATIVKYGTNPSNDAVISNIEFDENGYGMFNLSFNGKDLGRFELSVPGIHNIYNASAAILASYVSDIDLEVIRKNIKSYNGVGRRFEVKGSYNGALVVDDYAHHPKELKVTLEAAMKMGFNRVWAVHQPFTYTRTSLLLDDFAKVLQIPDKCVISAIMGSREVNTIGIKAKDLADKVPGSIQLDTFEEITDYVLENAKPGDLVITLGCGDVYKVSRMMIKKLKEQGYEAE